MHDELFLVYSKKDGYNVLTKCTHTLGILTLNFRGLFDSSGSYWLNDGHT